MRKFAALAVLLILPLAACEGMPDIETPAIGGTSTEASTSPPEPDDGNGSEPISGSVGVVARHDGNRLVVVPFSVDDGGEQLIPANRAQREACQPGDQYPKCLP